MRKNGLVKAFLSVVGCVCLAGALSMTPLPFSGEGIGLVRAADSDYEYTLDEEGNATITAYNGSDTELVIPDTLDGHTVVAIGEALFRGNETITSVVMPDTVLVIYDDAFWECSALESVTLSKNLVKICDDAFFHCAKLAEIEIPKTLTEVGITTNGGPFAKCMALKEPKLEDGLTRIPTRLFSTCFGLEQIEIPDSVTVIGESAFSVCKDLKEIVLGENVTTIEEDAFYNCTGLESVQLSEGLIEIQQSAFWGCDSVTSLVIPDSVTSIGNSAFGAWGGLTELTLGKGLTELPLAAFMNCYDLQEVVIPRNITSLGRNAFSGCGSLIKVVIPHRTIEIDDAAFHLPDVHTFYGYSGSDVEVYADWLGAEFVAIDVHATDISLNAESLELEIGKTGKLILTITPEDCTDEITWTSEDETIATVSDAGVVTANALGTTTITVTVGDLSASCVVTVIREANPFADVDQDSWQYPYAKFAVDKGLMAGKGLTEEGKIIFEPNTSMTRAEFVQTLYSKEGKPVVEYKDTFSDVPEGAWFADAVIWANENGIVAGSNGKFNVSGKITRQEMALILYKYAVYKELDATAEADLTTFADDETVSTWAITGMKWAVSHNVIGGTAKNELKPLGQATRAEAATMLRAFMIELEGVEE